MTLLLNHLSRYRNCFFKAQSRKATGNILMNQTGTETRLPVYMDISIFSKLRRKETIERLHLLGLSISYDRVIELSTAMCEIVNGKFQKEKVLCICRTTTTAVF